MRRFVGPRRRFRSLRARLPAGSAACMCSRRTWSACCSLRNGELEGAADVDDRAGRRRRPVGGSRSPRRGRFCAAAVRARRERSGSQLTTGSISVAVTLRPFGLRWSAQGRTFAAIERPTPTSGASAPTLIRHCMARERVRSVLRPGRQDRTARQARAAAAHARARRAGIRRGNLRSAVQALAVHDRARRGIRDCLRSLLRHAVRRRPSTSAASTTTITASTVTPRSTMATSTTTCSSARGSAMSSRTFTELTGRMAFGPRWSLGYANTAMSLTDAPDAQATARGVRRSRRATRHPALARFISARATRASASVATCSRGTATSFREPRRCDRAVQAVGSVRVVVNLKPCLLDDHPAFAEVAARGAFVNDARYRRALRRPVLGRRGRAGRFHASRGRRAGGRRALRRQVLDYGIDAGWNDNNEYEIWDDDGVSHGFGQSIPIERSRPLQALLMTRATAEAQARASRRRACVHRDARRARPASSAMRRRGPATTRRAGTRCAGTSGWASR